MCLSLLAGAHDHGNVARALEDLRSAAFSAGHETLQDRAFVDHDRADLQLVDVGARIVLGVRGRGVDHLVDDLGGLLVAELQQVERARDRQATHLVGDQAGLLRRDAHRAEDGFGFHFPDPLLGPGFLVATVTLEGPGDGKFAELVADHVLVDQHGNVDFAVVDGDGETHHFREDHGTARPGLDRLLAARRGLHLLDEVVVDEWAFLEGTCHVLSAPAVAHDELLRALVLASLVTLGRRAPRGDRMRVALASLGLAATVRVVDRVHGGAAHGRLDAAPALRARLAQLLEVVLDVADFTNGGAAVGRHLAHLAGAEAQRGVTGIARDQLRTGAGGAGELGALARLHFDAMHGRTDRHVAQRQGVADLDRRVLARHHLVALGQALRRDDVAALAIGIAKQRDVRSAVRVVLDPLHARRDAFLVALEVDEAVRLLVATTDVTGGDAAHVVAAAGLGLLLGQRVDRAALVQAGGGHADHRATAGRSGFESLECHVEPQALAITSIDWPSARRTYAL